MSLNPGKCDFMLFGRLQKALPQIHIFNRPGSSLPVFLQPAVYPMLVKSIRHIFGIRNHLYPAGAVQRFQPCNNRHQFHSVIRRFHISSGKLLFMKHSLLIHILQYGAVSAGPFRISPRSTVRKNLYIHRLSLFMSSFLYSENEKPGLPPLQ